MTRSKLGLAVGVAVGAAGLAMACGGGGGGGASGTPGDGGLTDATIPVPDGGGAQPEGAAAEASAGDASDGGNTGDGGASACAAPSVATHSVVCVTVSPEAIAFLSDPAFDGKGLLTVGVYASASAADDAGLGAVLLPAQDAGAGGDGGFAELDLSRPVPVVRFEVAATTAYVRAIFIDNPVTLADGGGLQAGWWLGGYDLSHGIADAPLSPVTLTPGTTTNVTLDLLALRKLTVDVRRDPSVTPAGNGEGPLSTLAINTNVLSDSGTYLFGLAQSPCANVSGDASAVAPGWVVGNGPYYLVATLDDFDAGGNFPSGGLFSLVGDGGAVVVPAIDQITYEAGAYQVTGTAVLTYLNPWDGGADADTVSCP